MNFTYDTQQQISQFAKEQAYRYLEDAEMTYVERIHKKTGKTKEKILTGLSKFKISSDKAIEAQNDMIVYMSDYMNDLISQGMTEEDALEKTKYELASSGQSYIQTDIQEKFIKYYEGIGEKDYESMGLWIGGFLFIGMVSGTLLGYMMSGGRHEFFIGGWLDTVIGMVLGTLLGLGIGLITCTTRNK